MPCHTLSRLMLSNDLHLLFSVRRFTVISYVQTLINKIRLTVHEKPGQGLTRNVTAGPEFVISEKCANVVLTHNDFTSCTCNADLTVEAGRWRRTLASLPGTTAGQQNQKVRISMNLQST